MSYQNIRFQDVATTLNEEKDSAIVTGKGGVGKSTISAAMATAFVQNHKRVLGIDLDGSPSMSDALGERPDSLDQTHNHLVDISYGAKQHIQVALLGEMFPGIPHEFRAQQKKYEKEIERLTKLLVPDQIDGQLSFAPLLRLALQSLHFGIPVDPKNLAHIIQMLEIFVHKRHLVSDFTRGEERSYVQKIEEPDFTILDTENTNNVIHLTQAMQQLVDLVKDIAGRDVIGSTVAAFIGKFYNVMGGYMKSSLAHKKNAEYVADSAEVLQEKIMGNRMALICVTNPGMTETTKTVRDITRLAKAGRSVDAVVDNRWPTDRESQKIAVEVENKLLRDLDKIGLPIAFQRIEVPGGLDIVVPGESGAKKKQRGNLQKVATAMGF